MEQKRHARFVINPGLLERKHVINGDQWKEAREMTEIRIFDRIYRKICSLTIVASVFKGL